MERSIVAALVLLAVGCENRGGPDPKANPAPAADPSPSSTAPAASGTGRLEGRVLFSGTAIAPAKIDVISDVEFCADKVKSENVVIAADGSVKNAVVTIHGVTAGTATKGTLVLRNKHCNFEPHVASATVGGEIEVTNEDPVNHTTHAKQRGTFFNRPIGAGDPSFKRPLRREGVIEIKCDIHKWMTAWVVVHENDYHAVTDAEGKFSIANVPAGTYTVKAWHEELGTIEGQVTIEADGTASKVFTFKKE